MDIFAFFGGVWASLVFGIFVIAMVVGCAFDRRDQESIKWWVFALGLVTLAVAFSPGTRAWGSTWDMVMSGDIWRPVGYYLLAGVIYACIEFAMEIRRSVRYWSNTWENYKGAAARAAASRPQSREDPAEDQGDNEDLYRKRLVSDFLQRYVVGERHRIISAQANEADDAIEPKVNRGQLAESIGCWTIFWPFYAISLIIGDLLTEGFRIIADLLTSLSGRFVRMSFKNVFKF